MPASPKPKPTRQRTMLVAGIDLPRAREGASTITIGFLNIFKKTSRTRSKLHESYSNLRLRTAQSFSDSRATPGRAAGARGERMYIAPWLRPGRANALHGL
jgi:hypothetical protein